MRRDIQDVIDDLTDVVDRALEEKSRVGFFAALYRRVTIAVQRGIRDGTFEDGPRMEALDVVFADRYLDALRLYSDGGTPTRSWVVAFDGAENGRLIILQHLFLGINAHINLDLGIAAAQVVPAERIDSLKGDFDRINGILASLVDDVQRAIGEVSPWLRFLDRIVGRADEQFADFSLGAAREAAWSSALSLSSVEPEARAAKIEGMDEIVAGLAKLVVRAGPLVRIAIWLIRMRESRDTRRIIEALR